MENIEFRLRPSRCLIVLYSAIGVMAFIVLLTWQVNWLVKLPTLILLCVYCWYSIWMKVSLRSFRSVIGLQKLKETKWRLCFANGEQFEGVVQEDSVVTRYISIMRFREPVSNRVFPAIICVDSVDPGCYRRFLLQMKDI